MQKCYKMEKIELNRNKPFIIAGPCILESDEINHNIAQTLKAICAKYNVDYIFKASFDKANRTSISSFRGNGIEAGLQKLADIKSKYDVPVLTDIHESYQAKLAAEVVDILQIPAFLCRQTDLLLAAAATNKIVNVKKAQFLGADDMKHVVNKLKDAGNDNIMLTERGTMFGYQNLVVDFRNILEMKEFGYPVIMDATHATQRPGAAGGKSGGNPEYAPYLAYAATVCGVDGYFFEVHPEPKCALSDASTMINFEEFENTVKNLVALFELRKSF